MLSVFAEFETNLRHMRRTKGIAEATAWGFTRAAKTTLNASEVQQLHDEGLRPTEIASTMVIDHSTVSRVLRKSIAEEQHE